MVRPVDGPKPQQVRSSAPTRPSSPTSKGSNPVADAPDSGFAPRPSKPVSISGRYPVPPKPPPGSPLYSAATVASALPATAKSSLPPEIAALIDLGVKLPSSLTGEFNAKDLATAKKDFAAAQKAIASGKYGDAAALVAKILSGNEDVVSAMGENAPIGGDAAVKSLRTVQAQLEFLSKLEAKGIKADYPPTEAQLVSYFKTLKDDPNGARDALGEYLQDFHVHPANVPGAPADVVYSPDKMVSVGTIDVPTSVPDDWSEVANRPPGANAKPESIGKQMNDCEGFGFISQKLLTAAGFEVKHNLTVHGSPVGEHAMVSFTHKGEKGVVTVTSNDHVGTASTEKAAAKAGYEYADPNATGKEQFFTGKTMQDSQVGAMTNGAHL